MRSAGDGSGGDSGKREERGVAGPRLRPKVRLRDENPFEVELVIAPWLCEVTSE